MAKPEECTYCSKSFNSEKAYLTHLSQNHESELGAIDQRRVDQHTAPSDFRESINENIGIIAIGVLIVASVAIIGVVLGSSSGGETVPGEIPQPNTNSQVHSHGFTTMTVNGEELDLTRSEFQGSGSCFHFHPGQPTSDYHLHCTGVTPAYAAYTLGVTVTDEGTQATFNGEEFSTAAGDTIEFRVNGGQVDPYSYELTDRDRLDIVLNQSEE